MPLKSIIQLLTSISEDMRIYLPKSDYSPRSPASVNYHFWVDKSLCLPKLKSITVSLYDFSFKYENFATFTFVVKDMFNLQSKTSKVFLTSFSNFY